jgi:hypothetical protein
MLCGEEGNKIAETADSDPAVVANPKWDNAKPIIRIINDFVEFSTNKVHVVNDDRRGRYRGESIKTKGKDKAARR